MIKMIASDFDGTLVLLHREAQAGVSERDTLAIKQFQQNGGKFIIATGRHPSYLSKTIGNALSFDAIIGFSGSITWVDDEIIAEQFTIAQISELYAFAKGHADITDIFMCNIDNDHYFTSDMSFAYRRRCKMLYQPSKPHDIRNVCNVHIPDFIAQNCHDSICRMCFSFEDTMHLNTLNEIFMKEYSVQYELVQTGERQYEIMRKGVNKAFAIEKLRKRYKLSKDEIAVVGDSYNDIAMFHHYPHSFCIAHTSFNVTDFAAHTVNGVADVIAFAEERK